MLIHPIGMSLNAWRPVLTALEAQHDVIALDLPGFGASPPFPRGTPSTIPALAGAVEDQLDAAGLSDAHLAGNSLGGWVALELARRGRGRTVVAFSPAGMLAGWEIPYNRAVLRLHRAGAERLASRGDWLMRPAPVRAALCGWMMGRPWRLDPGDAAHAQRVLAEAPGFHETLEWIVSHRAEGLDEIRVPALIAWGRRDRLLFPRQGRRFAQAIPGAELRILPGLGHVPMSDDPALVARVIVGFTRRSQAATVGRG